MTERRGVGDVTLYEHSHRGNVWRFQDATYHGRRLLNCRKWYMKDGELRPTKEGFTMPLERVSELCEALMAHDPVSRK